VKAGEEAGDGTKARNGPLVSTSRPRSEAPESSVMLSRAELTARVP
jgi:hypothetical protein